MPRKDEVDKAVNTINSLYSVYMEQKELIDAMKAKMEEQDQEIEQLKTKCNNQFKSIQELEDSITHKNRENEALSLKLQENQQVLDSLSSVASGNTLYESDVPMEDDCFEMPDDKQALEEGDGSPSHDLLTVTNKHHCSPVGFKRTASHVSSNKVCWTLSVYIQTISCASHKLIFKSDAYIQSVCYGKRSKYFYDKNAL